jgi:hypothetical protein
MFEASDEASLIARSTFAQLAERGNWGMEVSTSERT